MAFILKVHRTGDARKLVCVTDKNILGKTFSEGNKQLDFSSSFYQGEENDNELIEKHIKSSYMTIFSGKEAVEFGVGLGLFEKEQVLVIGGVPQAQVLVG